VPGTVPRTDVASPRASSSLRAPWFAVSCCPPNVARTLASLAAYVATTDDDGLQLHQYASARIRTTLADGRRVDLDVETAYPRGGVVRVTVATTEDRPWTLTLRVPAWADGAELRTPDGTRSASPGTVSVHRRFAAGDVVELHLPMAPRVSRPDPRIDAVRGCVVVERGPEVLALESVDLGDADVSGVHLDLAAGLTEADGRVLATLVSTPPADDAWPYGAPRTPSDGTRTQAPLIAYHDWANRGPSTMRVWLPLA